MYKNVIGVEGMKCPKCEEKVCKAFEKTFGAKKASASHKKSEAQFLSEAEVTQEAAAAALDGTGFKVVSCTSTAEKKGLFGRK
ncbi:MAG: cation transporter [Ruminococcus sp.]|nr:cation transporter [Ruminococcus sp.]